MTICLEDYHLPGSGEMFAKECNEGSLDSFQVGFRLLFKEWWFEEHPGEGGDREPWRS